MNKKPFVSIILPVWNGEKYLRLALESIKRQTMSNYELIIVNDCSTDSSLKIVEEFAKNDDRIHIINNPVNMKLPASLNFGFSLAKADYFTWTSDDNILHDNFLEVMLTKLEKSGADIVYSDFNSIDEDGIFSNISKVGDSEALICYNTIGASFVYKREVHERLSGYDTKCFLYEDYDFWIRAYLAGFSFHKFNTIVYDYRRHPGALTSSRKVPDDYAFYRYRLRKRFKCVKHNYRFECRELLIGYWKILGPFRVVLLILEALLINPIATFGMIFKYFCKLILKLRNGKKT
jgi:glycosyltransferase involved in cell wall biosynthesis